MRSYLECLFKDLLEPGKVRLTACILTNNHTSHIMIKMGVLAEYTQVEMLLGAIPHNMRVTVLMKLKLRCRNPSILTYVNILKYVLNTSVTGNAVALIVMEGACSATEVSPYSVPAGVPHTQWPVVMNLPAIPSVEIPSPT